MAVVHLAHTPLSPRVALERTIGKVDRIEGVVVVIKWDDGSFAVDFSTMSAETLAAACIILDEKTRHVMRNTGARSFAHPEAPEKGAS